jgi:hypothetical protein
MTLFTLSLCNKTSHISDTMVTERYSAYCMSCTFPADSKIITDVGPAPAAEAVRYETVKFNLTPIMKTEYVGYGPSVDAAWDVIANDSTCQSTLA